MRVGNRSFWTACAVGAVVGILVGRGIYVVADQPNLAALLAVFLVACFVIILAILGVVALAVSAFGDRGVGGMLLTLTISMGVGAFLAVRYADGIQIVRERPARIEVTLGAPVNASFAGTGTCLTVPNGELIRRIEGDAFIDRGEVPWRISMTFDDRALEQHRVAIVPSDGKERTARYLSGVASDITVSATVEHDTGSVTFTHLRADPGLEPMGGPGGPDQLDGSATWKCD